MAASDIMRRNPLKASSAGSFRFLINSIVRVRIMVSPIYAFIHCLAGMTGMSTKSALDRPENRFSTRLRPFQGRKTSR